MFHAGVGYRDHAAAWYNPQHPALLFDAQLCQVDLFRLATHNPLLVVGKVIPPPAPLAPVSRFSQHHPRLVFHTPSNAACKGTVDIRRMMHQIMLDSAAADDGSHPVIFVELGGWNRGGLPPISHREMCRLRSAAHLYVDQFSADIGGFGVSALEAMSTGVPTLASTQNIPPAAWSRWGVHDPVPLINLSGDLATAERVLRHWCLTASDAELEELGRASARFVERYFSAAHWSRQMNEQFDTLFRH